MAEKNTQLAKENNEIKAQLRIKEREVVDMMKRSVKAEYYAHNTYKEVIKVLSNGIVCMEECINVCRQVMDSAEKGYSNLRTPHKEIPPPDIIGSEEPAKPISVLAERDINKEADPPKKKRRGTNKSERLRCMRSQYGKSG